MPLMTVTKEYLAMKVLMFTLGRFNNLGRQKKKPETE